VLAFAACAPGGGVNDFGAVTCQPTQTQQPRPTRRTRSAQLPRYSRPYMAPQHVRRAQSHLLTGCPAWMLRQWGRTHHRRLVVRWRHPRERAVLALCLLVHLLAQVEGDVLELDHVRDLAPHGPAPTTRGEGSACIQPRLPSPLSPAPCLPATSPVYRLESAPRPSLTILFCLGAWHCAHEAEREEVDDQDRPEDRDVEERDEGQNQRQQHRLYQRPPEVWPSSRRGSHTHQLLDGAARQQAPAALHSSAAGMNSKACPAPSARACGRGIGSHHRTHHILNSERRRSKPLPSPSLPVGRMGLSSRTKPPRARSSHTAFPPVCPHTGTSLTPPPQTSWPALLRYGSPPYPPPSPSPRLLAPPLPPGHRTVQLA
jgi:hypothetical protein